MSMIIAGASGFGPGSKNRRTAPSYPKSQGTTQTRKPALPTTLTTTAVDSGAAKVESPAGAGTGASGGEGRGKSLGGLGGIRGQAGDGKGETTDKPSGKGKGGMKGFFGFRRKSEKKEGAA
jgi:hypothetical protein